MLIDAGSVQLALYSLDLPARGSVGMPVPLSREWGGDVPPTIRH